MSAAKRTVNWLSEDLIPEVFLRLPRKSLVRSRCVSKGLRNLIDCPIFKKRYDIFHNSVSDFAAMSIQAGRLLSMDFRLPDIPNSSVEKEVVIPHINNDSRFIGCCKGIVCLTSSMNSTESYILLNPFNETFQTTVTASNRYRFPTGFGYDYATDDYKIVRLKHNRHCSIQYFDVYSIRRDSWRQVVGEFGPAGRTPEVNGICVEVNGICVEGAIHWEWLDRDGDCIAVFDLETEVLRSLSFPPPLIGISRRWSLHDLGGRLCVFLDSPSGSAAIWVMEEYGVGTSWSPLFHIANDVYFIHGYFPLWDTSRLLCFSKSSELWLWLNTRDGSEEDIQIHKLPPRQPEEFSQFSWQRQSWVCVRSPLKLQCSYVQND